MSAWINTSGTTTNNHKIEINLMNVNGCVRLGPRCLTGSM